MKDLEAERASLEAKSRAAAETASDDDEDDDDVSSPFDHPYFLPVLLWALAAWFGYDGFINQDPDMLEHLAFNRWGFAALATAGVYFTVQAIREKRAEAESDGADS